MRRLLLVAFWLVVIGAGVVAQLPQTVVTCPAGQVPQSSITGTMATVVCIGGQPPMTAPIIQSFTAAPSSISPGGTSTLTWALAGGVPDTITISPEGGKLPPTARTFPVQPGATTMYELVVANTAGSVRANATVTVTSGPVSKIWGVVNPSILGQCSAAAHDVHVTDGGDGFLYRVWHPQTDPSGCIYGHEHGNNPADMRNTVVRNRLERRFGYIGRRMQTPEEPTGHEEPHEGFKVFVVNVGDSNDEGRVNRTDTISIFHMGTGGPRRFTTQMHSNAKSERYQDGGWEAATSLMMNTGGQSDVCDPRTPAPTKDGLSIQNRCKVNSAYEIWGAAGSVFNGTIEVYRGFATPAAFDPITVFNRDNPTEVIYAWDPRVANIKNFPNTDWSGFRGCDREGYAQLGNYNNPGTQTEYWTNAMGRTIPQGPMAIRQYVSNKNTGGNSPNSSDISQFKLRRSFCGNRSFLGLLN